MNKCKSKTINGTECSAPIMNGAKYCYRHNPSISKIDKLNASKMGGKRFKVLENAPEMPISSIDNILKLLEININDVRKGRIDPKISNAIVQNINVVLKVYELSVIEKRIQKLEANAGITPQ